jgi:Asp-tRNA(Asn)/Glu-tRNA(Gln) amidotransferase A subunit family amidase
MSQPLGRSDGLPVGGQLIAPAFEESRMLATAALLERHLDAAAEVR